jgi:hypothetical protein
MEEPMIALPESARAKLSALEQAAEDMSALAASALAKTQLLEAKIGDLQQQSRAHPQVAAKLAAEVARLEDEKAAINEVRQSRQERLTNDRQLLAQLRYWIHNLAAGVALGPVEPVELDGEGRDDVVDSLAAVRKKIEELKVERRRVGNQPLAREELRARARAYVEELAQQAQAQLLGLRGDAKFEVALHPDARGPLVPLAWAAPDLLLEQIEELFPEGEGLPDKAAKLAAVEEELLALQRDEEALVARAIEQGQADVFRRPRADPRAVLGVLVIEKRARAAA